MMCLSICIFFLIKSATLYYDRVESKFRRDMIHSQFLALILCESAVTRDMTRRRACRVHKMVLRRGAKTGTKVRERHLSFFEKWEEESLCYYFDHSDMWNEYQLNANYMRYVKYFLLFNFSNRFCFFSLARVIHSSMQDPMQRK